jgi:hypothetical protein
MKKAGSGVFVIIALVAAASVSRIINAQMHLPNFAPLIALSVFAGAVVRDRKWIPFLVPVLGQLIADSYFSLFTNIPGFYNPAGMAFNYAGLLLATLLGTRMALKPVAALGTTLGAAVVFFLVSNFGYFAEGWNSYSFQGLVKTYVDGVPFFRSTLEGNLVCAVVLFGGYFLFRRQSAVVAQKVNA